MGECGGEVRSDVFLAWESVLSVQVLSADGSVFRFQVSAKIEHPASRIQHQEVKT
jgi:hypothetical protein